MKQLLLILSLMVVLASCKKPDNTTPQKSINTTNSKNSKGQKISSAGDGIWDLLGYGYDVTGQYANSNSAKFSIIDVEKLELEHPTYVENSGAETGTSIFEAGQNAEEFSRKFTSKVNIKGGTDLLFKGSIDANFDIQNKWSSKFIYSSYSFVAIKRRLYMLNDINILKNYLHQDFLNNLQTYSPQELVSYYGTHVFTDIKLGGKLELIYQSETSSSDRLIAAGAGATSSFQKIFSMTTTTTYNSTDSRYNFNEKAFVRTIGGNSGGAIFATITFSPTGTPNSTFNLAPWQSGITDANSELIDITPGGLIPISDLIADPVKAAEVKDYVTQYIIDRQVQVDTSNPYGSLYDGKFLRESSTGRVFVGMEGKLRHIETAATLSGLFDSNITITNISGFSNLPVVGAPIKINNGLRNDVSTGKVYFVEGNVARWITSMAVKTKYHFNWNSIVNVSNMNGFVIGAALY